MTQKGTLSPEDKDRLWQSMRVQGEVAKIVAEHRALVVEMIDKSSYREVARFTGLSTNTLQRWKRGTGDGARRALMTEPHDGHPDSEVCPGCPHETRAIAPEGQATR